MLNVITTSADVGEGKIHEPESSEILSAFLHSFPMRGVQRIIEMRRGGYFDLENRQSFMAYIYCDLLGALGNAMASSGQIASDICGHYLKEHGVKSSLEELESTGFLTHRNETHQQSKTAAAI